MNAITPHTAQPQPPWPPPTHLPRTLRQPEVTAENDTAAEPNSAASSSQASAARSKDPGPAPANIKPN
ncbi:hypothetical protein NJB1604_15830 [Mycobacterium marinum]|nr:hypothetical protein NJB1604_15830 [Mycobacterium marinum]